MFVTSNSATRVAMNTASSVNKRIHRATEESIEAHSHGDPALIHERLQELQREWDVERAFEALCGSMALAGVLLGAKVHRRFFGMAGAWSGMLLLSAVGGRTPAVALLRRLGFRTRAEIDHERYALKVLRGDFHALPDHKEALRHGAAGQILHMVRC